jgi:type II secretory pathway component PulM
VRAAFSFGRRRRERCTCAGCAAVRRERRELGILLALFVVCLVVVYWLVFGVVNGAPIPWH